MRKHFNSSLRIELSKNSMTLAHLYGWQHSKREVLSTTPLSTSDLSSPTQLASQLGKILQDAKCSALPTSVIVADELVRLFIATPPKHCSRIDDCRAAADLRFLTLYGEAVNDWQIEAEWDAQHPFLACALPRSLHTTLLQIATEHQLTLTRILPQFIATWNHWHRRLASTSWFGFIHGNHLTLSILDQQHLIGVRLVTLPDETANDAQWLSDYVNCEALRLNLPAPASLQLCGDIVQQWTNQTMGTLRCVRLDSSHPTLPQHRLPISLPSKKRAITMQPLRTDFAPRSLKRSVRLTPLPVWLYGSVGLLLCAAATVNAFSMLQQQHKLIAAIQRIEIKQTERLTHQTSSKTWTIPDAQASAAINAIGQLNLPWRDVWDAIEAATPTSVALLSIEPDAKKQIVKGMAEAKTSYDMLAYIEQLKKQEFFDRVILTKHEINEQDANKPYRFQFEAQWVSAGGNTP
ncbi:MAG TPA: PilN domain-containing protein [Burkholderiaceae bacterium]|jgi:Tfp pilus assembly protein PilN